MAGKIGADAPSNTIYRAYLFTGEVDFRRTTAVQKLLSEMIGTNGEEFDLEKFDGNTASAEDILPAVSTIPFFAERKVVMVDRVDRMNADSQERLAAFIPKLGEKSCLILLAGTEDPAKKRASSGDGEGKKGLRPALTSAVKAGGTVVNFAKLRSRDLAALVSEKVRESGLKMEPVALQTFSRLIEAHPSLLDREIEKLAAYTAGQSSVTLNDVENVTIKSAEDRVFPLIDAVAGGQPETAVKLLDDTFAASPKPENEVLKVVSLMARHFRLLYQAKYILMQPGVRNLESAPQEMRSSLMKEQNPLSLSSWQKDKITAQALQFTMEDLEKCLRRVLDCELAAKGISKEGGSPRLNLEILILRLSQRKSIPL